MATANLSETTTDQALDPLINEIKEDEAVTMSQKTQETVRSKMESEAKRLSPEKEKQVKPRAQINCQIEDCAYEVGYQTKMAVHMETKHRVKLDRKLTTLAKAKKPASAPPLLGGKSKSKSKGSGNSKDPICLSSADASPELQTVVEKKTAHSCKQKMELEDSHQPRMKLDALGQAKDAMMAEKKDVKSTTEVPVNITDQLVEAYANNKETLAKLNWSCQETPPKSLGPVTRWPLHPSLTLHYFCGSSQLLQAGCGLHSLPLCSLETLWGLFSAVGSQVSSLLALLWRISM